MALLRPIVPPTPGDRFDRPNESAFRRMVEQAVREAIADLSQVETLALPARRLDAAKFGLVNRDISDIAATQNVAAINAVFQEYRDTFTTHGRATIRIPPGTYFINAPIWAGFDISGDRRDWTLEAWGVRLQATSGLNGRVMFDMTGTRRATILGLQLFTSATATPLYGIQMAREQTNGHSGLHYFERVTIDGTFSGAALIKHSTELDLFLKCRFRNNVADGSGVAVPVVIVEGTNFYPVASEFASVLTTPTTNVDHYFIQCLFSNFEANTGNLVHAVSARRLHFHDCYFDSITILNDLNGLRLSEDLGEPTNVVVVKDTHFHEAGWNANILIDAPIADLWIDNSGSAVKPTGAVVRVDGGSTISGLFLRESVAESGAGGLGILAPSGAVISNADIETFRGITVGGDFTGNVRTTSLVPISLPDSARARIYRIDTGVEERLRYAPLRPIFASNTTSTLADFRFGQRIRQSLSGSSTKTMPDSASSPVGAWIQFTKINTGILTVAPAGTDAFRIYGGVNAGGNTTNGIDIPDGGFATLHNVGGGFWDALVSDNVTQTP